MNSTSLHSGLVIDEVSHAFGRTQVIAGARLTVMRGEVHCLLGPSGSGKTTLLRLVAGLERLQQGRIAIVGDEVASPTLHVPPEKRSIGFVFQDYALFPHLNVRDNVCFGISRRRSPPPREHARTLLASVGMSAFQHAMPHTLSGGQQQRVALARALARDPTVMLLDEPFSGLDARLRDEVRGTTIEVLKSSNVVTLMVTHDPHEAMMIADTISIIHDGRIEQSGTPDELYSRPINERVASSLGEANCFHAKVDNGQVSTPFGPIAAPSLSDGDSATVIVRPESIRLTAESAPSAVTAQVVSVRHLGQSVRVEAELPGGLRVTAVVPSTSTACTQNTVHLSLGTAGTGNHVVRRVG